MRPLCFSKFWFFFLLMALSVHGDTIKKSAAVYYGKDISYSNLGLHDYLIVESENISSYTHGFNTYKKNIYAYVSIGEAAPSRSYFKALKPDWKLSRNQAWNSTILDVSNDEYHRFIYDEVISPLVKKGYENFFFDTMDSYQLLSSTPEERAEYERGLIRFVKKFKHTFPHAKVIINRGFEVLDEIHSSVDAVLLESLYHGLSPRYHGYKQVSAKDRSWLLSQIERVKSYGLDVISVEYMDQGDVKKIKQTLEQIESLGVIPYISNKALDRYGQSSKSAFKREVLILYSSSSAKQHSNAHHLASLPLEYLGYIPVIKAIEEGLPSLEQMSRYRGVIIWNETPIDDIAAYGKWIKEVMEMGVKLLFLDGFGVSDDTHICNLLGIKKASNRAQLLDEVETVHKADLFGFETPLSLGYFQTLYTIDNAQRLLERVNVHDQHNTLVATAPWGGYALSGTVTSSFGEDTLWVIDPFSFFAQALKLEAIPVPDPTTQNGRRLFFAHIDGDAAMNRAEWNPRLFSIEVAYEKILSKYKVPQGVSIVEAEISSEGLYPQDSAKLQDAARKIFSLDHIEGATHTYTHPFKWVNINGGQLAATDRLDVKGYEFSIDREISGSLEYINTLLMPDGKTPAHTIYWTGDCMPKEDVLAYTYKQGLLNINGGDTTITNDKPWLSRVAPLGIKRGEYRQVYTGAENENVYTNDWHGPFWGFKKVIQTFELTESPRRIKPIDIYYHFYAASKTASLKALDEVYRWALSQEILPIHTSEYIPKVLEFYDLSMSKAQQGWIIYGMKELKTLRLDTEKAAVNYEREDSVLGHKLSGSRHYLHLNTQIQPVAFVMSEYVDSNYLVDANAEVLEYTRDKEERSFHLEGHVNLELRYHLKEGCELHSSVKPVYQKRRDGILDLRFDAKETDVFIRCR